MQVRIIAKLEKRMFNHPIEDIIDPITILTNTSIIDSNKPFFFITYILGIGGGQLNKDASSGISLNLVHEDIPGRQTKVSPVI